MGAKLELSNNARQQAINAAAMFAIHHNATRNTSKCVRS